MQRQRGGFTRFKIKGCRGEGGGDSSWLFTRHCHYLIKQLPATAPLQADGETAAHRSASISQKTTKTTSGFDLKHKSGMGMDGQRMGESSFMKKKKHANISRAVQSKRKTNRQPDRQTDRSDVLITNSKKKYYLLFIDCS